MSGVVDKWAALVESGKFHLPEVLRDHQVEVMVKLLRGRNVVLSVATGARKSLPQLTTNLLTPGKRSIIISEEL